MCQHAAASAGAQSLDSVRARPYLKPIWSQTAIKNNMTLLRGLTEASWELNVACGMGVLTSSSSSDLAVFKATPLWQECSGA
jgi:hypothetical protein